MENKGDESDTAGALRSGGVESATSVPPVCFGISAVRALRRPSTPVDRSEEGEGPIGKFLDFFSQIVMQQYSENPLFWMANNSRDQNYYGLINY
jgi:hypothetical protein